MPSLKARLKVGETLGDRVIKVDHAGEHGAVCIYTAQRFFARWTAPALIAELDEFLVHERRHRSIFAAELKRRDAMRCKSYTLCGLGGFVLGTFTGLLGSQAIAATTVAIETVVLRHMQEQVLALNGLDAEAAETLINIISDEREHHDKSATHISSRSIWPKIINPVVSASTETVIWLGMRL